MERLEDAVSEAANEAKKDYARTLINLLIWETPVDTSTALSNWQAEIGRPLYAYLAAYFEGARGSTQNASALAAISDAERAINGARPGQAIFISNAAPYIRDLNDGSSSQAPAGFIEAQQMIARRRTVDKGLNLKV